MSTKSRRYEHPGKPKLRPEAAGAAIDVNTWVPTAWIPEHVTRGKRGAYIRMCVQAVHMVMVEKQKKKAET